MIMVSKEDYKNFVSKLVEKDKGNKNVKYLSKSYRAWALAVFFVSFIVFGTGFGTFFGFDPFIGAVQIALGIFGIVFGIISEVKNSKTVTYYKENYRSKLVEYLMKEYKYSFDSQKYISKAIFNASKFAGGYDSYSGNDLLVINIPNDDGSESNVNLNLCDLHVTRSERDSDGDRHTVTVYGGMFGYIEFPFSFKCVLSLDSYYREKGLKLDRVKLEDIIFDKNFKAYSNDQIEARYILTPEMMEKLLWLESKFKGFQMTLVDNKMYIGASINLFELNVRKNIDVASLFDNFYDEVKTILEIVNEIKNNNKIFRM